MKADQAFAILSEANPVPDATRFDEARQDSIAFLSATMERNESMDTLERETIRETRDAERGPKRRRPMYAIAAVALVIAVGIAVAASVRSEPDVADIPAPPFDTPQQAAEAYLATHVTGDYDAYQALLAPDAWDRLLGNSTVVSEQKIEARFHWYSAYTGSFDELACEPESSTIAMCTYALQDLGVAEHASDGTITITRTFTIDEQGLLSAIGREGIVFTDEQDASIAAFDDWVRAQNPKLREEIALSLFGDGELTRPIEDIIADNNAALAQYASTLGS